MDEDASARAEGRRDRSRSCSARGSGRGAASSAERARIEAVIVALGDRLKVFSDILKLGRFFFTDALDLRARRREEAAAERRRSARCWPSSTIVLAEVEPYDVATLEKAVHDYAERTGRKMGDVVNPLRVAVTGQGVGPGLYDCLVILGARRAGPGSPRRSRCSTRLDRPERDEALARAAEFDPDSPNAPA